MLALNQVSVYFGSYCLFSDITFIVNERDRIGLVGRNGAGKSSLLKLIVGEMAYDTGSISRPASLTLGYLPQLMEISDSRSVYDETLAALDEWLTIRKRIALINEELSSREDYSSDAYLKLSDELLIAGERFQMLGGESVHSNVEQVLLGLGFERSQFRQPTSQLSGGWRMRIELAKILLKKPDLLLLDEPTNHLDIESIQWLEDFLKVYPGSVILISHDRLFLDNVCNRTIEIIAGKMHDYRVSFSKFEELRRERREQQLAAYRNQQKKIESTEEFIERFRYKSTKAVQVQSRIKQLEKIDRIEVDEIEQASLHFRFPPAPHCGNKVLEVQSVSKKYGDHQVLKNIDLHLSRGEKIAFIGKNGEGKSTLSKIILEQIPYEGIKKLGDKVKIGYFAQNQDEYLDESKTVFEIIDDAATGDMRTKTRDLLGSFLFSGESVDKKVKVLSGGERSRLALAKMLLDPVNFLVLDEPTNHLDLISKDILKQALLKFDGTVIIVSHDRYFLDGLVDKVYEFKNQSIKEYLGGIQEFLKKRKLDQLQSLERKNNSGASLDRNQPVSEQKLAWEQRKEIDREIRKAKSAVEECEKKIMQLEEEIARMDNLLANPQHISDESLFKTYGLVKKELSEMLDRWEVLHEAYEELEEKRRQFI